jgi:glycosyltransferase involved in cell wall biosynthesis
MKRFTLPDWVLKHDKIYEEVGELNAKNLSWLKERLKKFKVEDPEVSIVIPAYNEGENILKTLSSLSDLETRYKTELIVVNNNSKDNTQEILDICGVQSYFQENQGISWARQKGLEMARGKYILSADSDSIYPRTWIDPFVETLKDPKVSCAYGRYSFIPSETNTRFQLGIHETFAEMLFNLRSKNRECVNVMGFNFAYRKEDGLTVGGFNHNLQRHITGRSEDGWMALTLMKVGKIQLVRNDEVRVWTSDRRLMFDGNLAKAFANRFKKEVLRLGTYFKPLKQEA